MYLQHGCIFVIDDTGNTEPIPLEGATVVKKVDPSDKSARIAITYYPQNSSSREKIILLPPAPDVDQAMVAIQSQITMAAVMKSKWRVRLVLLYKQPESCFQSCFLPFNVSSICKL